MKRSNLSYVNVWGCCALVRLLEPKSPILRSRATEFNLLFIFITSLTDFELQN